LTQNGSGSILDVTGNDTLLNGGYTLTSGTAIVGPDYLAVARSKYPCPHWQLVVYCLLCNSHRMILFCMRRK
ncbi:MAG TPA: hypothetical protein VJ765_00395, partial [Chitinophagaceae bacterium]|nr:hypothetical protein [Chitinophagaceae bacterium]